VERLALRAWEEEAAPPQQASAERAAAPWIRLSVCYFLLTRLCNIN
jgi:hypothetical protein